MLYQLLHDVIGHVTSHKEAAAVCSTLPGTAHSETGSEAISHATFTISSKNVDYICKGFYISIVLASVLHLYKLTLVKLSLHNMFP